MGSREIYYFNLFLLSPFVLLKTEHFLVVLSTTVVLLTSGCTLILV